MSERWPKTENKLARIRLSSVSSKWVWSVSKYNMVSETNILGVCEWSLTQSRRPIQNKVEKFRRLLCIFRRSKIRNIFDPTLSVFIFSSLILQFVNNSKLIHRERKKVELLCVLPQVLVFLYLFSQIKEELRQILCCLKCSPPLETTH